QLDRRQKVETELATKIQQILEPAVGQGKVRPQVSVTMNLQQVEETVEQYDPQGSVIRSQDKEEERQSRNDTARGIPGPRGVPSVTASNPPLPNPATPANQPNPATGAAGAAAQPDPSGLAAGNSSVKQKEITNFEVSKTMRHVMNGAGKIDR